MICSIVNVQTAVPCVAIQVRELGVAGGYGFSSGNCAKQKEDKVHFTKRGNCESRATCMLQNVCRLEGSALKKKRRPESGGRRQASLMSSEDFIWYLVLADST